MRASSLFHSIVVQGALLGTSGCYLSHEVPEDRDVGVDSSRPDVSRPDVPPVILTDTGPREPDACQPAVDGGVPPDAFPERCPCYCDPCDFRDECIPCFVCIL